MYTRTNENTKTEKKKIFLLFNYNVQLQEWQTERIGTEQQS